MLATVALTVVLAAAQPAPPTGKTLWLVQSLYPGQELLVSRTEQALAALIPKDGRANEVIGRDELVAALKGKSVRLGCLLGEEGCADPVDALVAELGFDRVVLVKGGQDEGGYRYKVSSYRASTGEALNSSTGEVQGSQAQSPTLEKALLGALVKVVPLASTLELWSTPPGATVFIDDVKVGVTPLSTQALPGERIIRLDLGSHLPVSESFNIPVRGQARFERTLKRVPSRLSITATPAEAEISVDGKVEGTGRVDLGVEPGPHVVNISASGFNGVEETVQARPGETTSVDKALKATGLSKFGAALSDAQEDVYARRAYFQVQLELAQLLGPKVNGYDFSDDYDVFTSTLGPASSRAFTGVSLEYATFGRYFGILVLGGSYLQPGSSWDLNLDVRKDPDGVAPLPRNLTDVTAHVGLLRGLQPMLRVALWRFSLMAQAGAELRVIRLNERASVPQIKNGFLVADLMLAGQLALRLNVVAGLFVEGAYRFWFKVAGSETDHMSGLRLGLGYAY